MIVVGVDTGGTFTDLVCWDGVRLTIHKVLSTPRAPEQAILQGIAELGLRGRSDLYVVHGTTVATNAVLEGKGARTAFVTNRGLRDLLTIGRQARAELYELQPGPAEPPVPRELCLETGGRLGADGAVVEPLGAEELKELRGRIAALGPDAVAISLLFSFLDDRFERAVERSLPPGLYVSRSSAVLPEYGEYERAMATWLNARTGPLVDRYLQAMTRGLGDAGVSVMQSSGGTIAAAQAGRQAVRLLLSGPAGGLAGARYVARASGRERLLSFDMGGTSTDAALIEGEPALTGAGRIGPYPVAVPMVDIHTIGAGGGSIARVDAGGMLRVGPESAGADPGPACYGRGGRRATVTDANLVLGRIVPDAFLGGRMRLDIGAARDALADIARRTGHTVEAAAGVVRVVDEQMAQALRVISVRRGIDPRGHTLVSFGGAGGLHVCALAEAMGMHRGLVPVHAGVLSALGMLVAPRARHLSRSIARPLRALDARAIEDGFARLHLQGIEELAREGVPEDRIVEARSLDLRYRGQGHYLNLPWQDPERSEAAFHRMHEERYGHRLDLPVELVNLRLALRGPQQEVVLHEDAAVHGRPRGTGAGAPYPVHWRDEIPRGTPLAGPALVIEAVSSTFIAPGWRCTRDAPGNLLLERGPPPA